MGVEGGSSDDSNPGCARGRDDYEVASPASSLTQLGRLSWVCVEGLSGWCAGWVSWGAMWE